MKIQKSLKVLLPAAIICVLLSGCGKTTEVQGVTTGEPTISEETKTQETLPSTEADTTTEETASQDSTSTKTELPHVSMDEESSGIEDMLNDYYDDYKESGGQIAYVTDVSQLEDGSFNQTVYNGIRLYANSAGVSYSYYIAENDNPEEYKRIVDIAITSEAKLIVSAGVHFEKVIGEYQSQYPNISFLMIDGTPKDENGNEVPIESNVHCVTFREEESAYLAGYCAVLDGYRKLGFIGGEDVPPIERFGYGYLMGIDEASKAIGCSNEIEVYYWYSGSFLPKPETKQVANDWYQDGCEIIFACGGSLYESVLAAADEADGKLIGVDVDQSMISERIVTSALKGVDRAVITALDDYFAYGKWSEETGSQASNFGIKEWCGGLPTETWTFENVTEEDFGLLYLGIRDGSIVIPHDTDSFPNITVKVNKYEEQ